MKTLNLFVLIALVAPLWGDSCSKLLSMNTQEFNHTLQSYTKQMTRGSLKPTKVNLESKQVYVVLNRCVDLRELRSSHPSQLTRRTLLLEYFEGKDKETQKIVKKALIENKQYYSAISRESFLPHYRGDLIFLGIDITKKGEFFIEELRLDRRKLKKNHILLSKDAFATKVCSLSKARREYISQVIKRKITCLQDKLEKNEKNKTGEKNEK